jgi:hypothetical protein
VRSTRKHRCQHASVMLDAGRQLRSRSRRAQARQTVAARRSCRSALRLTSYVPLPPPVLLAGDFTSTVMVHNGTTSRPLSLANGHLLLADSAARACGYSASVFGDQRKLVLSYWAGPDSGPRSFSLCNSADFMQNMWLLTCPRPLETRDGADAAAEGCWCALPTAHHPCDTGAYGFQLTADTRPGHWWVYLWRSCLDGKGAAGFWNGGAAVPPRLLPATAT